MSFPQDDFFRYNTDKNFGLSTAQLEERQRENLINKEVAVGTKKISEIIRDNLFTLFNLINFVLAFALLYVGSYKNLLFIGVVFSNLLIGTYQEIRAKRTIDKLSILSKNKVKALRDGKLSYVDINNIVLDDIILLETGDQIPSDSILVDGICEVNESLLTGESDAIYKREGDLLLSGSFLVSGKCKARVEHISDGNYAFKISKDAKYFKKVNSEIMLTFKRIILIISILIIPIGSLLFINQLNSNAGLKEAVESTTAALIGMIPEGLVLLTSTVLAVGILRLSKHKVLVQELYCIETLARVDTLCLDKTGTLTEGIMEVNDIIPFNNHDDLDLKKAIKLILCSSVDNNPTINAIRDKYKNLIDESEILSADKVIPFSSSKKWSGAYFKDHGSYILGAPEFVFKAKINDLSKELDYYSKKNRVVILAHSKKMFFEENLPEDVELIGFILLRDKIRKEAKRTLKYFDSQGVDVKVISGDNVVTVSNVARRAGVKNYDKCVDLSNINTDAELKDVAINYSVFGRVTPIQKKKIINFLKENNHTVAMTGDGVNDVLALKESDCAIAMATGSSAAKNVSQLVLLNSNFDSLPKVVAEGRRSINNIQRSSSLFLVKTIYSTLLSIIFLFLNKSYPFMPIQMTLTSVLTIGIPSFILALEPNRERISGRFFINIIEKALPCAVAIVSSILIIMGMSNLFKFSEMRISTLCVISSAFCGFLLLFKISRPFNLIRRILFITMSLLFLCGLTLFNQVFSLEAISINLVLISIGFIFMGFIMFNIYSLLFNKIRLKNRKE